MNYAVIDIVLFVLVVLLVIRGFVRGFVEEFFSLGAPALGVLGAFFFYQNGGEFLRSRYLQNMENIVPEVLAFIAIFIIVFLICKITQKIIGDVIKGMNLSTLDKVLGAGLGLAEGILVASLILFVITVQPLFDSSAVLHGSVFGRILLPLIIETSREVIGSTVQA